MKDSEFCSIDNLLLEISEEEYAALLDRYNKLGYENDVERDDNGNPIDGDEYVLCRMRAISEAVLGM